MWKIEEMPRRSDPHHDWVAWLRTGDNVNIKLQIAYQTSEERAFIITQQVAGIINHNQEP